MKGFVVFFMLGIFSLPRNHCKTLGLQQAQHEKRILQQYGTADENRYHSIDGNKHLSDVKEFEDVSIEIDLLDKQELEANQEQQPIVIYQIGVSW